MATLYVEGVPDDVYRALKKRAKANRTSIAAEVIGMLKRTVPTDAELKRRREIFDRLAALRAQPPLSPGPFPSVEEMIREDRDR
jgi:plasmid stability protein